MQTATFDASNRTEGIYARQLRDPGRRSRRLDRETLRRELAHELGLRDDALLERLIDFGICADTASAFEALPLLEVAWADGWVDPDERWRVLAVATSFGLELGRPAHAQIELWLAKRPPKALFDAWYALAAARSARRQRGEDDRLVSGIHEIALAAGGVLGFGSVSRAERETIERIRAAL
ncbi:MAG: hypothetical protein QNK05_17700 [Myxococcota bacterium]|nr:hypothetical protein [Myxococcota bacterium]